MKMQTLIALVYYWGELVTPVALLAALTHYLEFRGKGRSELWFLGLGALWVGLPLAFPLTADLLWEVLAWAVVVGVACLIARFTKAKAIWAFTAGWGLLLAVYIGVAAVMSATPYTATEASTDMV